MGLGAIIGTGIFVLIGVAAHDKSGPALVVSFIIAGIACIASALCYSEFASLTPISGSAYTYAYTTLGEIFAWIIGWDLLIEYTLAASLVAQGWSHYFQSFLASFGIGLPRFITSGPLEQDAAGRIVASTGRMVDLPAVLAAMVVTSLLIRGMKVSAAVNGVMVVIKVAVILMVIGVGAALVHPANWHPFAPYGWSGISLFGHAVFGRSGPAGQPVGMLAGAAIGFFAYLGFEDLSTYTEECRRPQRDVPIAIMTAVLVSTVLYISMVTVLTGMVPYNQISTQAPVADAFARYGMIGMQRLVSLGALAAISTVLMANMLTQPRIQMAMGRDGLLPSRFCASIHPRFGTPWKATLLNGTLVCLIAGLLPIRTVTSMLLIGRLMALVAVCIAVLILRRTEPERDRPFRVPCGPLFPVVGVLVCTLLIFSLPSLAWMRLVVWFAVGQIVYFRYGRRHSRLRYGTVEEG
jgi:APA family basic amino acid/polyamine antiporter